MIAFGGRRGPHRSGSRCRGRPIERREAGREGCLWPNAASQGRPPDGSGGESERSTQNGRAKTLVVVVVVVVVAATPNYLRQASQNLGKYSTSSGRDTRSTRGASLARPKAVLGAVSLSLHGDAAGHARFDRARKSTFSHCLGLCALAADEDGERTGDFSKAGGLARGLDIAFRSYIYYPVKHAQARRAQRARSAPPVRRRRRL